MQAHYAISERNEYGIPRAVRVETAYDGSYICTDGIMVGDTFVQDRNAYVDLLGNDCTTIASALAEHYSRG